MEFFTITNTLPVHISDSKKGDTTIVLLHGYMETLYVFSEFSDLLERHNFRVISIDLPGHGLSLSCPDKNSMEFCAKVVYGVVHDICKVDKCILAGHSLGGYISQYVTRLYPELATSLIMLNSTPFAESESKLKSRQKEMEVILKARLHILASLSIPKMYAEINRRGFDSKIEETVEICESHDPNGIVASVRGMIDRPDNTDFLKTLKIPVKFIFGDSDEFISNEEALRIKELIPNAQCYTIENTGHNSFIEAPDRTLEIITTENY